LPAKALSQPLQDSSLKEFAVTPRVVVAALLLASLPGLCEAKPAYWYRWQSKTQQGVYVCSQTYPGVGWIRIAGPFKVAGCKSF
jgi:hypothetical protein